MSDRYITKERMQKFLERGNDKSVSNVAADEIQATVGEVGKGRGLGSQTRSKKRKAMLSQAGQNLYDSSAAVLEQQKLLRKLGNKRALMIFCFLLCVKLKKKHKSIHLLLKALWVQLPT